MKNGRGFLLSLTIFLLMLSGCSKSGLSNNQQHFSQEEGAEVTAAVNAEIAIPDVVTGSYEKDDFAFDWGKGNYEKIRLDGDVVEADGPGVAVAGSIITISASGVYEITGTLTDGSILVEVDKSRDPGTVFLVLNDVQITSQASAPIYVKAASKTVLLLAEGTENILSDTINMQPDENNEPRATIFSKDDLTITGSGSLTVIANYNDAINGRDDVFITDGTIIIDAADDGIVGKDSVNITGGSFVINAGKDGIRSSNEIDEEKGNVIIQNGYFTIIAGDDGIQAVNLLQIEGGVFGITSGGGYPGRSIKSGKDRFGRQPGLSSAEVETGTESESNVESRKGIKARRLIVINGGDITISSYDDAVHSDHDIIINGGVLLLQSGDDGIHADNSLIITDGDITIDNSYEGLEAADITITGGSINLVATDDGINIYQRSGLLTITDGDIYIWADGDGIDSNGNIYMTGGTVFIDGPTVDMEGAIDYDGWFTISGGTLVASGSSRMAEAPGGASTQPSILMYYSTAQVAVTPITLRDEQGNLVITFTPSKEYTSVVLSSPALFIGATYTFLGGETEIIDVYLTDMVTYLSESGVTIGPQGMGDGRRPGGGQRMPPR